MLVDRLPVFIQSGDLEVQERVSINSCVCACRYACALYVCIDNAPAYKHSRLFHWYIRTYVCMYVQYMFPVSIELSTVCACVCMLCEILH